MRVVIRDGGLALEPEERDQIDRRLRYALSRFEGHIGRVSVRLTPRSALDERGSIHCRLSVTLAPSGMVRAEDADDVAYEAVGRAADRMARTVARDLEWRQAGEGMAGPQARRVR
jgi:ribosome-associated translation inhibitor RaiA